jgi:prevent-host-death family protein
MEIRRMGIRQLRDSLGSRIDAAHFRQEPTIITHNGQPRAVIVSYEEWAQSHAVAGDESQGQPEAGG